MLPLLYFIQKKLSLERLELFWMFADNVLEITKNDKEYVIEIKKLRNSSIAYLFLLANFSKLGDHQYLSSTYLKVPSCSTLNYYFG